jgi:hypothetical protein
LKNFEILCERAWDVTDQYIKMEEDSKDLKESDSKLANEIK